MEWIIITLVALCVLSGLIVMSAAMLSSGASRREEERAGFERTNGERPPLPAPVAASRRRKPAGAS